MKKKKGKKKTAPKAKVVLRPPDRPYLGMKPKQLGNLNENDIFWFDSKMTFLSGVLMYQSLGSTRVRVRAIDSLNDKEYIEETNLSKGSIVLVKEVK